MDGPIGVLREFLKRFLQQKVFKNSSKFFYRNFSKDYFKNSIKRFSGNSRFFSRGHSRVLQNKIQRLNNGVFGFRKAFYDSSISFPWFLPRSPTNIFFRNACISSKKNSFKDFVFKELLKRLLLFLYLLTIFSVQG